MPLSRSRPVRLLLFAILFALCTARTGAAYAMPVVSARSAVVMDARTGIVLYAQAPDERAFPASVTKVMTALLAIENGGAAFQSRVPFSHAAVHSVERGSSNIAMDEGESLSLDEALHGLMLASANEVANALAEAVADDMQQFALRMNARAESLGAVNTHFTNAHGLPEDEHYTTAYDMALIMREAVRHPKFVELIGTRTYEIPPTELQPEPRLLNNSNRMIWPGTAYYDERVIGGKTGFTDAARHTLVSYAREGDTELIVAVLQGEAGDPYRDTSALLDYGFEQFAEKEILNLSEYTYEVLVDHVTPDARQSLGSLTVQATGEPMTMLLPLSAADYMAVEVSLPARVTAPVEIGDHISDLRVYCNHQLLATYPLTATEAIALPEGTPTPTDPDTFSTADSKPMLWALLTGLAALTLSVMGLGIGLSAGKK